MGEHHLSSRTPVVLGVNGDVGPFVGILNLWVEQWDTSVRLAGLRGRKRDGKELWLVKAFILNGPFPLLNVSTIVLIRMRRWAGLVIGVGGLMVRKGEGRGRVEHQAPDIEALAQILHLDLSGN
jgi:hypothetical protein